MKLILKKKKPTTKYNMQKISRDVLEIIILLQFVINH